MKDSLDIIVRGDGTALIVVHIGGATHMWCEVLAPLPIMYYTYGQDYEKRGEV